MHDEDPLSIRQIQVFVALTEQGSFTKAARYLRLSQSTVSGHISDLERRIGLRLVERDRSGVRPTDAGRMLLRPAREVLRSERSARMAMEELSGLLRGLLVVGGSTLIMALLGRFPILVWAGAALLGWVAGELIATEPSLEPAITALAQALDVGTKLVARAFEVAGALLVISVGWLIARISGNRVGHA